MRVDRSRLAVVLVLMLTVIASGCTSSGNGDMIIIDDGTVLAPDVCTSRGLDSQVTVFHSETCPACQRTVPILEEIRDQGGISMEFIDVQHDGERIEELGIKPRYIPAVIISCKTYVGYRPKSEFLDLLL